MMKTDLQRRRFLKTAGILSSTIGLAGLRGVELRAASARHVLGTPHARKLGWRLGCLFNCFRPLVLDECADRVKSLGLGYLEGGSRPAISAGARDIHLDPTTSQELRAAFKNHLAVRGVKLVSYYTYKQASDEGLWRKEFEFARDMGIEILIAEPEPAAFDIVERLCDEYQVCLAVHNHTPPSRYWDPRTVLEVCRGRTPRIGICGDTGHWVRSGIDPAEAVKRLEGRILAFHLKDVDRVARDAKQVPWGAGKASLKAMLQEVHRQRAKPLFIMEMEFEPQPPDIEDQIVQSIGYFDQVAGELLPGNP